jgi:hypothetical protein
VWNENEISQPIIELDLNSLPNGIYWVYGRTVEGEFVEKIQLQQ